MTSHLINVLSIAETICREYASLEKAKQRAPFERIAIANQVTVALEAIEKRTAVSEMALRKISEGEGYYGLQAREYKDIARAALNEMEAGGGAVQNDYG